MNSSIYKKLDSELDAGKKAVILTILNNMIRAGDSAIKKIILTEQDLRNSNNLCDFDEMIYRKAQYAMESGNLQFVQGSENESYLLEPCFPEPRLIIFGGGHIAKPLAEFGARVGFLITVVDDRPMFANANRFPDAEKVICESFENCFSQLNLNESSFAVIVTRGHRHDLDCLKQVLKHRTAYTGMIGSRRRVKSVKEQLLDEGYTQEQLNKVNAPIGLEIGAVTPEEIAVSILAQVISYRRLAASSLTSPTGSSKASSSGSPEASSSSSSAGDSAKNTVGSTAENAQSVKVNWPELDRAVLEDLCKEGDDPRAIITIVSTKGSVPRKAGAKMLVWPYGKTLGSIGGGCSEGEVIQIARDIIRNTGFKIQEIDMTGQVAEEEGMACGGIMEVIIEFYSGS